MDQSSALRKNPSRQTCEEVIKRILTTEFLQQGNNRHFRSAADFMSYFESLYPASDALTKQVQRAVKAMNMPKDENGYFIVNKTAAQLTQEKELTRLFSLAHVTVDDMENCETVFLAADCAMHSYLIYTLEQSVTLRDTIVTIFKTSNGLLIYTRKKQELLALLSGLQ